MTKVCIVIDAYKFSSDIVAFLKDKGIAAIHVYSSAEPILPLEGSSTYDSKDYLANFNFDGELNSLLSMLDPYDVIGVFPATEPGVTLGDLLSDTLKLASNGAKLSQARRNKYFMIEALKANGVPAVKDCLSSNADVLVEWIEQNTTYPVVLKPPHMAGSIGVYICDSAHDVRERCDQITNIVNDMTGERITEVIAQELLHGTEYMVDSVSCEGKHYLTNIYRCSKIHIAGHGMIYDREEFIDYDSEERPALEAYCFQVLNALGIRYGAAHSEIMFTEDGPILIETGARINGHFKLSVAKKIMAHNQMELALESIIDPIEFHAKTQKHYQLLQHMSHVILSSKKSGRIKEIPLLETINSCKSLDYLNMWVKPGDMLEITHDLDTIPGTVYLVDKDQSIVDADYQKIQEASQNGFILI